MQMIKLEAYKLLLSKIERNSIWVRLIFTNFYFLVTQIFLLILKLEKKTFKKPIPFRLSH